MMKHSLARECWLRASDILGNVIYGMYKRQGIVVWELWRVASLWYYPLGLATKRVCALCMLEKGCGCWSGKFDLLQVIWFWSLKPCSCSSFIGFYESLSLVVNRCTSWRWREEKTRRACLDKHQVKSHVSTCDNLIEIFLWPLTPSFCECCGPWLWWTCHRNHSWQYWFSTEYLYSCFQEHLLSFLNKWFP